jgi:23S rRNA pseudouridine1911/1915/1917 synthase
MITNGQIEPNAQFILTPRDIDAHQRIDNYLAAQFSDYSRSFLKKLITSQAISRNGTIITKPSTPIVPNDIIIVTFPPQRTVEPTTLLTNTMDVAIIAKTDHFMVIYKPAHLLVHAPSKTSTAITLTDWILHNHTELAQIGAVDRPGIVHRLDKETSGIMVITRTNYAHSVFGDLFRTRAIHKTYLALVDGHPDPEGTINYAIGRDPINRIKMTHFDEELIDENNMVKNIKVRRALTNYKVLEYFEKTTLIEVKPTTGRTHQIRVHMAAIGHPIIGDQLYGTGSLLIDRQALHAHALSFTFDDTPYTFRSNIPEDFQELIRTQKKL